MPRSDANAFLLEPFAIGWLVWTFWVVAMVIAVGQCLTDGASLAKLAVNSWNEGDVA